MNHNARTIMKPALTVAPEVTLAEAARTMDLHRISSLPVIDTAGALAGVITKTDLLHYALSRAGDFPGILVGEAMNPSVVTVSPQEKVNAMAELMEQQKIHHLFVVEEGRLLGVVSSLDLTRVLMDVCSMLGDVGRG